MVIMQHAYVEPTLMSIVLIMQVNRDLANSNLDFAGAWRCVAVNSKAIFRNTSLTSID